jgi:hypothetical protein
MPVGGDVDQWPTLITTAAISSRTAASSSTTRMRATAYEVSPANYPFSTGLTDR